MITKGIWIDDPVRDVLKPEFWDTMVAHDLSTGAIMVERLGNGFDEIYTSDTLKKIRDLANKRDIELVLTVWPEPNKGWMDEFEQKMPGMLEAAGAAGLEFDLEGNWLKKSVVGFPSLDKAGDAFVSLFQRVAGSVDVRTEVTTYPFHLENSKSADVAQHADRLLPQAYSVRNRSDGDVAWDGNYGPGSMQKITFDRAMQVPGVGTTGGPLISCGLAAYDQVWPGKTGEEAMRKAWDTAAAYEPVEIRFWSSKWVFGVHKNGYASRFLMSMAGK